MPAKVRCNKATSKRCPNTECRHRQWHDLVYRCTDPDTCWLTGDGRVTIPAKCVSKGEKDAR
jgi:hypothetical protein